MAQNGWRPSSSLSVGAPDLKVDFFTQLRLQIRLVAPRNVYRSAAYGLLLQRSRSNPIHQNNRVASILSPPFHPPPPPVPQSSHSTTWQPPSFEIWITNHLSLPSFSNFRSHFRVKVKTYMEIRWSLRFHVKLESSFDSLKLRFLQSWK